MTDLSLIATASYLPDAVIGNDFFGADRDDQAIGSMFRGTRRRHHVAPDDTAADMIARAALRMAEREGIDLARDVELILTNVSLPDHPFTGCGARVAGLIGVKPRLVIDLHNTGCVSFVYMMKVAQGLFAGGVARTALICNAQTAAGRVFADPANRHRPQAAVPGDGCGVGFLVANRESPVLAIATRCYPDFADDMQAKSDCGLPYWAPRSSPLYIDFDERRVATIASRGNALVPAVVREACESAGLSPAAIDVLVTNQPSPIFLRNWRESLGVSAAAHVHTFPEHGNLFGAAIPIALERAVEDGVLQPGRHVALGGFSHAGDYAAAAVVRWKE
jgi:3-oxoacyl-[acyl-carrier-protein] synthase-3